MKRNLFVLLMLIAPFLSFSQGVKANTYDKFLKKQRVEMEPVWMTGLGAKSKLSFTYTAIGTGLFLDMSGTGWGTTTIDKGDEFILLFSNDSTITLRSGSLQSFEPGLTQNTYKHQYQLGIKDLETISKFDLSSVRKYSFKTFADLQIPKDNAARIKKQASLFLSELKKSNVLTSLRKINMRDIRNYIGDSVEFCSKVYKTRYYEGSDDGPTLLDVQADFSDPFVNVVILGKDRKKFSDAPERIYLNKDVCINGVVTLRNGIPYVAIHNREQIKVRGQVSLAEIDLFEGDSITVSGKIFTARYLDDSKTKPTLLNMGAPYPDQPLTLVIESAVRNNFNMPEEAYLNKTLRIKGKVVSYKGKPQIALYNTTQVEIIPDETPAASFTAMQGGTMRQTAQNAAKGVPNVNGEEVLPATTLAQFPGGENGFMLFLRDNLHCPPALKTNELQKVVASFQIDERGKCSDIKIEASGGYEYDNEVKRVLTLMPRWKPAAKAGKLVKSRITQPITFKGIERDLQQ